MKTLNIFSALICCLTIFDTEAGDTNPLTSFFDFEYSDVKLPLPKENSVEHKCEEIEKVSSVFFLKTNDAIFYYSKFLIEQDSNGTIAKMIWAEVVSKNTWDEVNKNIPFIEIFMVPVVTEQFFNNGDIVGWKTKRDEKYVFLSLQDNQINQLTVEEYPGEVNDGCVTAQLNIKALEMELHEFFKK